MQFDPILCVDYADEKQLFYFHLKIYSAIPTDYPLQYIRLGCNPTLYGLLCDQYLRKLIKVWHCPSSRRRRHVTTRNLPNCKCNNIAHSPSAGLAQFSSLGPRPLMLMADHTDHQQWCGCWSYCKARVDTSNVFLGSLLCIVSHQQY